MPPLHSPEGDFSSGRTICYPNAGNLSDKNGDGLCVCSSAISTTIIVYVGNLDSLYASSSTLVW